MFKIYNTLTKKETDLVSLKENTVTLYQCGPTVYWTQHIGNMRAMVIGDSIYRSLQYLGYNVSFARNYTDVGHLTGDNIGDADQGIDKMEKATLREKTTPETIAEKYIQQFEKDTQILNVLSPTFTPRATEHIADILQLVEALLEKNFAYTTPHAVYFDITKKEDYTKLSGQDLDKLQTGKGVGEITDPDKKHPQDFALWFFKTGVHVNALQTWRSPFVSPNVLDGEGFPGWHIECSAMIKALLGETVDIHIGGIEHIPIHHTNEIAQSESAHGVPLAHIWMHNEHLLVDGKKMAKSEGTAYFVTDIIERGFNPLSLRYLFLGAHYRTRQNFTWEALESAEVAYTRLIERARALTASPASHGTLLSHYKDLFIVHLKDDFNIPGALSVVWNMLKDTTPSPADVYATLLDFDQVLGLDIKKHSLEKPDIPEVITDLVAQREEARTEKNWDTADTLRADILKIGYEIRDTDEGPFIKKI
jgi:cysteinyl-tRNA synthetase